ncbi:MULTISPECIES: gas vesicle protein GvpG [Evansella]|jgi:hypothetical protein|uniref:gas vesicle protein GvpG n=1 Tax=Evansella TaxID=2837485 RepID=UPI00099849AD|nr:MULTISPECIES: gas vesicle protein GvpG [Evansella]UTR09782.1 gas vesicle protein GvpG [Evansella sp. LMS18]
MIFKLFTWPIDTVRFVGEKVYEEAEKELYDLEAIQRKLVNLQLQYEMNEISEEEFQAKEDELVERYEIAKQRELDSLTDQ